MRNQYAGSCYVCGLWVPPGAGYFERFKGGWRVQCEAHPKERRERKAEAAKEKAQ